MLDEIKAILKAQLGLGLELSFAMCTFIVKSVSTIEVKIFARNWSSKYQNMVDWQTFLRNLYLFKLLLIVFDTEEILPSSAQASQLGAEIALLSLLWGTTIHHTVHTPRIVVLRSYRASANSQLVGS